MRQHDDHLAMVVVAVVPAMPVLRRVRWNRNCRNRNQSQ